MGRITLITGGARSGKSAHALELANARPGARRVFIATAEALDDEMAARIANHRRSRPPEFRTVDVPVNVASALEALKSTADIVLLDCLTLWVSNLMRVYASENATVFLHDADYLVSALKRASFASIVVTDEVGSGIVPDNPDGRRFRDYLGWVNQRVAAAADEVILMVAGVALKVR